MDNSRILKSLQQQRDVLFQKLNSTSISELCKKECAEIKSGRIFIFDNKEKQILSHLKRLSKDASLDNAYKNKIAEYLNLDNEKLVDYFVNELARVFNEIVDSGKQDEIQACFIEYDDYSYAMSCVTCYGHQEYPLIEAPRYIQNEFDFNKQVLFVDNGINFQPAWMDCPALDNLDYLEINYELQELFKLHSRTLLHKALDRLNTNAQLTFLKTKPFSFYINEHDCEEMLLYRME
jgi:hypothetical protein